MKVTRRVKVLRLSIAFLFVVIACQGLVQSPSSSRLLVVGLGRVGAKVARQASSHFDSVVGTVRDPLSSIERVVPVVGYDLEDVIPLLADTSHVLVTIPAAADATDKKNLDAIYDAVASELEHKCWLGIISTTGVYGNHDGAWVTEESECKTVPGTSARRFLEYEDAWCQRAVRHNHSLSVFRCAGIYGPGRSALHTVYKRGLVVADKKEAGDVTNRIHEHDLARAVVASMWTDSVAPGDCTVYNLADDLPESRKVVMEYAADLLKSVNAPVQTRASEQAATGRASRRRTDRKLVSNQKMKDGLLTKGLLYPTYREGLQAILNDPQSPWSGNDQQHR